MKGVGRRLVGVVAGHPFTAALTLTILILALVTGPIHGPRRPLHVWLSTGPGPVSAGHWWSPVTSVLFCDSLGELVLALILTVVLVGVAEHLMGTWRTALAYFMTSAVGILAGVGIQLVASGSGEMWARNVRALIVLDVFTAVGGAIMTASAFAGALWRRRIRLLTALVAVVLVLYSGLPGDLYRLLAVLAGLGLGVLLRPSAKLASWVRSSHHEIRVLLASALTITAIGPVIGLVTQSRNGLLSPIKLLFTNEVPEKGALLARCQAFAVTRQCVRDLTIERINGLGPILLSVLPLLVLLVAAYGLLRGSRFAVWLAVSVNLLLALLSGLYFGLLPLAGLTSTPHLSAHYWEVTVVLTLSALLPLVIAIALIALRRHFPVRPRARAVRRYLITVLVAGIVLAAVYVAVGYALRETGFTRVVNVWDLLGDVLERFIPVNFLRREPVDYLPTDPLGTIVYHNVGTVFWLVAILAAIPVMRGGASWSGATDALRVRTLLQRGGET
ncbi:hypothetical protein [Leifsonia poae]|uniref:hypothetical protein n=1 Tax=Leifsonia poae TaxID=110933 RepID=UPI003D668556